MALDLMAAKSNDIVEFIEPDEEQNALPYLLNAYVDVIEPMALAFGRDQDFFNRHRSQPVATHRLLH